MELDISNDPEIERLGANATALYALDFWERLCQAARKDGQELDPLWNNTATDEKKNETTSSSITITTNHHLEAHYTKQIVITSNLSEDLRLYRRFRSNFGQFCFSVANMGSTKSAHIKASSPLSGDRWASLLLASEGIIEDYNFMTLLRENAIDMFWMTEQEVCDGCIIVPRAQFVYIELARIHEGLYGKEFRYQLQLFDIKTQSDILLQELQKLQLLKLKQQSTFESNNDNNNNIVNGHIEIIHNNNNNEQRILQALHLLQTQWPHPPLAILKETGVIKIVKKIFNSSLSFKIQEAAKGILQYWQDFHELGRIPRQQPRVLEALQRAGRALHHSSLSQHAITSTTRPTTIIDKERALTLLPTAPPLLTKTTSSVTDVTINYHHNINNTDIHQSSLIFQQYGILILDNIITKETLQACQIQARQALLDLIQEQLEPRNLQIDGDNAFDFPFCRQRPGHRVDNRYHILDKPMSPIAKLGQELLQLLPKILLSSTSTTTCGTTTLANDDDCAVVADTTSQVTAGHVDNSSIHNNNGYKILYGGVVHSFPRKSSNESFPPAQIWHRDGPSLFERYHHETHCFNVFIPLIDITIENGTTEFIPGTHADTVYEEVAMQVIPLAPRDPNNAQHDETASSIRPIVPAGTVIAFDIRLLHRGLSNTSDQDRPILYFTIAKDWFVESHMFQTSTTTTTMMSPSPSTTAAVSSITSSFPLPPRSSIASSSGHRQLTQQLYQMITGQSSSRRRMHAASQHHIERNESISIVVSYGHPHYTTRFDLLLLEQFQQNNEDKALQNLQAILAFSSASVGDKEAMTREFVYSFGEMAILRKRQVLEMARHNRNDTTRRRRRQGKDDKSTVANDDRIATLQQQQDFSTIEQDLSDVAALYKLTATILLEESILLAKLGFTVDDQGIWIVLALLKAHAKYASPLTDHCHIGVSVERLEETFTSWWHAGKGRFAFWQWEIKDDDNEKEEKEQEPSSVVPKKLLVVFSSLGSGIARPEWCGSLRQVANDNKEEWSSSLDVLHVLDPAFSWYCQDPTCRWQGGDYYTLQLSNLATDYDSVMFLGDSMGAAAALRFSGLANYVLAFTPQVDITNYEAITRLDFTADVKEDFKTKVIETVKSTSAVIEIHYGDKCEEDVRQVQLLPQQANVHLVAHDFDDHILSIHLRETGQLMELVKDSIQRFMEM